MPLYAPVDLRHLGRAGLTLDRYDFTRTNGSQSFQQLRKQGLEVDKSIRARSKYDDREGKILHLLLEREIAINSYKCVEPTGRASEQRSVPDARPSEVENRPYFVTHNLAREATINTFVEQQPHEVDSIRRSLASSRK